MIDGEIEHTRFLRNPLDVLAQQIVAHVSARGEVAVADVAAMVRRTATFAELSDELLRNTLEMLAGRYPVRGVLRAAPAARVEPGRRHAAGP